MCITEQKLVDALTIHMMRREFEVFDSCLKTLPGREYRITYDYIHKDRKVSEIAEGEDRADQSIRNLLVATRKTLECLESRTIPFFRETI